MSGLISYSELQQSAPLPVAIDYPAALALRQMALIQGKISAGTGSQRPAPLCSGSASQDAAGYPVEHLHLY